MTIYQRFNSLVGKKVKIIIKYPKQNKLQATGILTFQPDNINSSFTIYNSKGSFSVFDSLLKDKILPYIEIKEIFNSKEIWKPIKGYEKYYQISSFGRVKRLLSTSKFKGGNRILNEKILKPLNHSNSRRYKRNVVILQINKKKKTVAIARLVAQHFISADISNKIIVFKDGNYKNCRLDNILLRDLLDRSKILAIKNIHTLTLEEISRILGYPNKIVGKALYDMNISFIKYKRGPKLTETNLDLVNNIINYCNNNPTKIKLLCEKFNINRAAMTRIIKKYNIKYVYKYKSLKGKDEKETN